MKHIITLLLLVGTLSLMAFSAKGEKQTIVIKTQIYCDHCLKCASCGANINDKIRDDNKGIKSVDIDPIANTITVVYNDAKTSPDKIKEAILAAGYDVDDKKASAETVAKLDVCCKKH
ncbi:MAG: heavy metal-associated domain-containing protein [Bacteroidia bacterium]